MNKTQQQGGTIIGFILGLVVGLGAALGVAVYVTKVPVPFLNKGPGRGVDLDAAESAKNKNWDPNSPLYGKNPARPTTPVVSGSVGEGDTSAATPSVSANLPIPPAVPKATAATAPSPTLEPSTVASIAKPASPLGDPLGDLAKARDKEKAKVAAQASSDPFDYFVQAGAFRTQSDADAQRAKLAMLGWEARVSEREQNGRTVFRVRVGPFGKRDDAEQIKEKLDSAAVESALVRVQR